MSICSNNQTSISIPQSSAGSPADSSSSCTQDKCAAFLRDGQVLCDLRCIDPLALPRKNSDSPLSPLSTPRTITTHSSPDSEKEAPQPAAPTKRDTYWSAAKRRRLPHHVIERRYRDNLNGQIESLRLVIGPYTDGQSEDVEDGAFTKAPSKAEVIASATDYVKELQRTVERLQSQERALKEQVSGLQRLVRCEDCSVMQYLTSLGIMGDPA